MLDKTFRPSDVEARHYERWEKSGVFGADVNSNKKPYTIMMPPPNVTGSLHMGHALNQTLQDILIRYRRMKGDDVLWMPGTDHAGIATQMVVERMLEKEGIHRRDLGREAFVDKIWEWKEHSGSTITRQLRRLGASPDWQRERFTMDEGLSKAVLKVFVTLYEQGLIYRDKRLVNWDPKLHTAISDLEVEQRETKGNMWHIRYPIEGEEERYIVVATTRPETMFGDTAVAVHPDDERYKDLVGKFCVLPVVGRRLPIIADEYADPEQGSGAVKITPAHDFNDFEVGKRNNLEMINIFDANACINENGPEAYQGMDRFDARKKLLAELEEQDLIVKVDEHVYMLPYGDRSHVVVEPWLTDQWFVDAKTLAQPAIKAVEEGKTRFVPKNWEKTYFDWLYNIQPWCISRQLWWGHQIPAWYGPDGEIFVAESEDQALEKARSHYGDSQIELTRETDVLDTWFSSALWPFSTLGWPDETPELKRYYPGDVLITGFDIIFFWVARMMMMGLHFMGDVPFRTVYIHALVRDEKGQKMSKSKGNVMDPLELCDKFGADALRFTLTAMAAQGRDIKLSESRVEGYRNFGTKLWNAARFCQMNKCLPVTDFDPTNVKLTVDKWIVGKLAECAKQMDRAIADYRFNDAAGAIYHFAWGTFCDWYLEFTKPLLSGEDTSDADKSEIRATTAWVLDQLLTMLNPIMPFITEELYENLAHRSEGDWLIQASWPELDENNIDPEANDEMDWVVRLVSTIRSVRADMHVPAGAKIPMLLKGANQKTQNRLKEYEDIIKRLARLDSVGVTDKTPKGAVQAVIDEATIVLPIADVIDIDKERDRLNKEIHRLETEIQKIDKKLSNENFLAKAPEEVVAEQRERKADAEDAKSKLEQALRQIEEAA